MMSNLGRPNMAMWMLVALVVNQVYLVASGGVDGSVGGFDDLSETHKARVLDLLEEAMGEGADPIDVIRLGLEKLRASRRGQTVKRALDVEFDPERDDPIFAPDTKVQASNPIPSVESVSTIKEKLEAAKVTGQFQGDEATEAKLEPVTQTVVGSTVAAPTAQPPVARPTTSNLDASSPKSAVPQKGADSKLPVVEQAVDSKPAQDVKTPVDIKSASEIKQSDVNLPAEGKPSIDSTPTVAPVADKESEPKNELGQIVDNLTRNLPRFDQFSPQINSGSGNTPKPAGVSDPLVTETTNAVQNGLAIGNPTPVDEPTNQQPEPQSQPTAETHEPEPEADEQGNEHSESNENISPEEESHRDLRPDEGVEPSTTDSPATPSPNESTIEKNFIDKSDPKNPKKIHIRLRTKVKKFKNGKSRESFESRSETSPNGYNRHQKHRYSSSSYSGGKRKGPNGWSYTSNSFGNPGFPQIPPIPPMPAMPIMPQMNFMPYRYPMAGGWPGFYGPSAGGYYGQGPVAYAGAFAGTPNNYYTGYQRQPVRNDNLSYKRGTKRQRVTLHKETKSKSTY